MTHPTKYTDSEKLEWYAESLDSKFRSGSLEDGTATIYKYNDARELVGQPLSGSCKHSAAPGFMNGSRTNSSSVAPMKTQARHIWTQASSHRAFEKVRDVLGFGPQTYYNLDSRKTAGTYRFKVSAAEWRLIQNIRGVAACRPRDASKWSPTVSFI